MELRRFVFSTISVVMLAPVMTSCGSDEFWSQFSGCKNDSYVIETRSNSANIWDSEGIEYEARKSGELYLKHINGLFNCATVDIKVSASVDGTHIRIVEIPIGDSANCVCPMDVECLLKGLNDGEYTISFYERDGVSLRFEFKIAYSNSLKGAFKLWKGTMDSSE